jgi:rRNA processing protein Krr1/Pno1
LGKLKDSGTRYFLPDALYLKATYLRELSETKEARKVLQEARAVAEEIESRIILWKILGDLGEAKEASEIVESIAGNISDAALRETFRNYSKSIIEREQRSDQVGI